MSLLSESTLLIILTFNVFYLTGLIWVIQLVHYPSFSWIVQYSFSKFEAFHQAQMSKIVVLPMIVELLLSILGVMYFSSPLIGWVNLVSVLFIWGVTFFVSVPCHAILARGYHEATVKKLIVTNWYRTILWTLRAIVLAGLCVM